MEDLTRTQLRRRVAFLEERNRQLELLVNTDGLTGLLNRRACDQSLAERPGAYVIAIDLNGFKAAQDAPDRGHPWGDALLRRFADWLRATTREHDYLAARPGGDEFVVVASADAAGAQAVAERVQQWEDSGVTASAGVGASWDAADAALYRVKAARRSKKERVAA